MATTSVELVRKVPYAHSRRSYYSESIAAASTPVINRHMIAVEARKEIVLRNRILVDELR